MPYIQQNTPPPNRVMNFSMTNFSGGLNNRANLLEVNQASDVLNMAFSNDDIMEKRFGSTAFDDLVIDGEVTFVDEYKPFEDEPMLIRASDTELYIGAVKVLDLSGRISGVNYNGKYYFCDNRNLFVYGKFPMEESTYVDILGDPVGDYHLMRIQSSAEPPQLDETHTEGVTVYSFFNNTITYQPCKLEVDDTFKGVNYIPVYAKYLALKQGRLFMSGATDSDDTIYISDSGNGYYFPVVLSLQLPPNSDEVTGMHMYDDSIVVGRKDDMYAIHGITNRTDVGLEVFHIKALNTHTGFASHHAINKGHNYLFFLGNDGNSYLLGNVHGSDTVVATQILSKQLNIFKDPVNISKADLANASSIFYEDTWYLSIKDKILVYSYRSRAWTMYEGLHARSFYDYHGVLAWGDKEGRISIPSEDYLDYGKPFRAHWTSRQFDMNDANSFKQFREFFIVAHTFDDFNSDVYVSFEVDHANVPSKSKIRNQMAIWGESLFGDRFLTRNINASLPFIIGRRGRNIRFTVSNGFFLTATIPLVLDLNTVQYPKEQDMIYVTENTTYYKFEDRQWQALNVQEDLNQPMRVYQINGDYELRGKR